MKFIYSPSEEEWQTIIERPTKTKDDIEDKVAKVFKDVRKNGDAAVQQYTAIYDGVDIENSLVSAKEIRESAFQISSELKEAIQIAKENIEKFHLAQKTERVYVETMKGVVCWQEKRAIQRVGLYIPGGTASLFSTVLMLAIPAKIANCKEIVLCTPPSKKGLIHPAILYASSICGVSKIIKVGGIQAIASLTFGTETIPRVYKIFGPGNQYVTSAKQYAIKYKIAIDMPAGPSELLVVADDSAKANFVASDLLSQAEHGEDSQVVLVSTSMKLIDEVSKEIRKQIVKLPRIYVTQKAIENSKSIFLKTDVEVINFINEYAPEHLVICVKNKSFYIDKIENAGSVFIGNYTPESAGDYASGTNHTLPTNGFSKSYSGVNLDSFTKSITFQEISKNGIKNIGKYIEIMAESEGLKAHKNSVTIRLKD